MFLPLAKYPQTLWMNFRSDTVTTVQTSLHRPPSCPYSLNYLPGLFFLARLFFAVGQMRMFCHQENSGQVEKSDRLPAAGSGTPALFNSTLLSQTRSRGSFITEVKRGYNPTTGWHARTSPVTTDSTFANSVESCPKP